MKRLIIRPDSLVHILLLLTLTLTLPIVINIHSDERWDTIIAILSVFMLCIQLITLKRRGYRFFSIELWFVVLSYLFMLSRIIMSGLFGVQEIYALRYVRTIYDQRFSDQEICLSAYFALVSIEAAFVGFLLIGKNQERLYASFQSDEQDSRLFSVGKLLLIIGIPCFAIEKSMMIFDALRGGYGNIGSSSGLIDDFANFMVYGFICIIASNSLSKKTCKRILYGVIIIFGITMLLTGDRRYEIISILTILLVYMVAVKLRLKFSKLVIYGIAGIALLYLLFVLREVRYFSILSDSNQFSGNVSILEIIKQSGYEFGGSIYALAAIIKSVPSVLSYRYGATLLSGFLSIIPFGFLYQNLDVYQYGRLSDVANRIVSGTFGASVFGDMYGNFGIYAGITLTIFLGILITKICYKQVAIWNNNYHLARYFICFYALLSLPRASFTEVTRTLVWGLLALHFIYTYSIRSSRP